MKEVYKWDSEKTYNIYFNKTKLCVNLNGLKIRFKQQIFFILDILCKAETVSIASCIVYNITEKTLFKVFNRNT